MHTLNPRATRAPAGSHGAITFRSILLFIALTLAGYAVAQSTAPPAPAVGEDNAALVKGDKRVAILQFGVGRGQDGPDP